MESGRALLIEVNAQHTGLWGAIMPNCTKHSTMTKGNSREPFFANPLC